MLDTDWHTVAGLAFALSASPPAARAADGGDGGAIGNTAGEVAPEKTSEKIFRLMLQIALTLPGLRLFRIAAQSAGRL